MYGVSKKDHINYSYISTIDDSPNEKTKTSESLEVNQLSTEQRRVVLPAFKELITYVYEMSNKRLSNSSTQRYVYGRATLAYSYEIYTEVCAKWRVTCTFRFEFQTFKWISLNINRMHFHGVFFGLLFIDFGVFAIVFVVFGWHSIDQRKIRVKIEHVHSK